MKTYFNIVLLVMILTSCSKDKMECNIITEKTTKLTIQHNKSGEVREYHVGTLDLTQDLTTNNMCFTPAFAVVAPCEDAYTITKVEEITEQHEVCN